MNNIPTAEGFYTRLAIPGEVYYLETILYVGHIEYRWHWMIAGATGLLVPAIEMQRIANLGDLVRLVPERRKRWWR